MTPAVDFTSSLYLGLRHASRELGGWTALTTGRPAVLEVPPGAADVAGRLAALVGAPRAVLARSTLHALGDCLDVLAGPGTALIVDAGLYPVGRWAVQRAAGGGTPVHAVAHHDPVDLAAAVTTLGRRGLRPVLVADGLCTGCGCPYPLAAAVARLRAAGGCVLLDDTQALGIVGAPVRAHPYGRGGGGSVRCAGVDHGVVVTASSLAKGFGAPTACVAGPAPVVARVAETGSAVHSGPPSAADVAAARHALDRNDADGDRLRATLADLVRRLRRRAAAFGLALVGGLYPVQSTPAVPVAAGRLLLARLAAGGVRALLRRTCRGDSAVTLVVTVAHRPGEVDRAARLLGGAWQALHGAVPDVC